MGIFKRRPKRPYSKSAVKQIEKLNDDMSYKLVHFIDGNLPFDEKRTAIKKALEEILGDAAEIGWLDCDADCNVRPVSLVERALGDTGFPSQFMSYKTTVTKTPHKVKKPRCNPNRVLNGKD